jgi:signal peptidase I
VPGDAIEVEGSCVTLNGKRLPLEKIRSEGSNEIFRETSGATSYEVAYDNAPEEGLSGTYATTVPEGSLYVLGDNRSHASDSRRMGTIPFSSVIAKKW